MAVNSIAVCATVNGVEYVKSVEGLDVTFNKNMVRPINVTNMAEKPADYNLIYTEGAPIGLQSDWAGDYYTFKFTNNEGNYMVIAFHPNDIVDGALPVGTFEVGGLSQGNVYGNGSYFDAATIGTDWNVYFSQGSVIITKSDDIYSVVVDLKDLWTPNGNKTVNATFEGSVEVNNSGVDTTGYSVLTTATHSFSGSTLSVTDTTYELNVKLYNGGAGSTVMPGEYTFNGVPSIEGTISGAPLIDGSKATIYNNGDGTYTILFDITYQILSNSRTAKYYYTFSN